MLGASTGCFARKPASAAIQSVDTPRVNVTGIDWQRPAAGRGQRSYSGFRILGVPRRCVMRLGGLPQPAHGHSKGPNQTTDTLMGICLASAAQPQPSRGGEVARASGQWQVKRGGHGVLPLATPPRTCHSRAREKNTSRVGYPGLRAEAPSAPRGEGRSRLARSQRWPLSASATPLGDGHRSARPMLARTAAEARYFRRA
jgi:hypothetical protein